MRLTISKSVLISERPIRRGSHRKDTFGNCFSREDQIKSNITIRFGWMFELESWRTDNFYVIIIIKIMYDGDICHV